MANGRSILRNYLLDCLLILEIRIMIGVDWIAFRSRLSCFKIRSEDNKNHGAEKYYSYSVEAAFKKNSSLLVAITRSKCFQPSIQNFYHRYPHHSPTNTSATSLPILINSLYSPLHKYLMSYSRRLRNDRSQS